MIARACTTCEHRFCRTAADWAACSACDKDMDIATRSGWRPGIIIRDMRSADIEPLAQLVATAHRPAGGQTPPEYLPAYTEHKLHRSLSGASGMATVVAELDGEVVGLGQAGAVGFGRNTWALQLSAVRPDLQGFGIHRVLVAHRLEMAQRAGAGLVVVSALNDAIWRRYGFESVAQNPATGAWLMFRAVPADASIESLVSRLESQWRDCPGTPFDAKRSEAAA